MTNEEFILCIQRIYDKNIETVKKKNADYSGIDPFGNFRRSELVGVSVERAILVRMMDKISRISNLLDKEAEVKEESITDALEDLINYSAILITWLKNKTR